MSTMENIFWHVIGYGVMPVIFLAGFFAVSVLSLWILSRSSDKETSSSPS